VWLNIVMPVDVFVYAFQLMPFLFVDAVEAFELAVGLGVVDAA